MSLLDDIIRRSAEGVPAGALPAMTPETETYTDYSAGFPQQVTRPKQVFPDVPSAPRPSPLSLMAPQAGILAPGIGRLGALDQDVPVNNPLQRPPGTDQPDFAPGTVPLPMPRPVAADAAADTDFGATRRMPVDLITPAQKGALADIAPTLAAPAAASPFGASSILDRITTGLGARSNTLLALAAGFGGAPSIGQGISRAAAAAIPARAADLREQLTGQNQRMTTAALLAAGVPMQLAVAAQGNPALMKTVSETYFADRKKELKMQKDALGNEHPVVFDPYAGKLTTPGAPGGAAAPGTPPAAGMTAAAELPPSYDPTTNRDEKFLGALDPTTAAAVKSIADGNISGTGRNLQKLMPLVARYENGFSQGVYTSRNKFNTEFGSQTPSSVGGQKVLMGTALGHLAEASESAAKLGNSNGFGSADLASAVNAVKNRTTANDALANAHNDIVAKFSGEVGKLYSGSQGGGVHEREETRQRLGPNRSSESLAAGLEAAKELIFSKQQALEQQAVAAFGPEGAKRFDFLGDNGRKALAKIDANIAKLRGQTTPNAAPAAAPVEPTAVNPKTGARVVFRGGQWQPLQ